MFVNQLKKVEHKIKSFINKLIRYVFVFSFGAVFVHSVVMLIDHLTYADSSLTHGHTGFIDALFTLSMFPMMLAYGVLSLLAYVFWDALRLQTIKAHQNELQVQKQLAIMSTMQKITALMVQFVAAHNNQINIWVEERRKKGREVPPSVHEASQRIAKGMLAISHASFSFPYEESELPNLNDYALFLEERLKYIEEISSDVD